MGCYPKTAAKNATFKITADLPDGRVEPLLWLSDYESRFKHSFLLRTPLEVPAGTIIAVFLQTRPYCCFRSQPTIRQK